MKISILIPTRDRSEFLKYALATCVRIDHDIEIVVSDNASEDATRDVVSSFGDNRIKYVNTGTRVSQRLNFENVIGNSTGEYVFMIGDDDGILGSSLNYFAGILEREKPDVLSVPSIFYRWPSPNVVGSGRLKINKSQVYGKEEFINSSTYLSMVENFSYPKIDPGPKVYHGFSSRKLLDRLKHKTGWYIASGQIDMYFATASLAFMERYMYVRHPASILAMGPKSGGLSVAEQHMSGGSRNNTADAVALEALSDPVKDPIDGKMPILLMYLLNGVEQGNRCAFDGKLKIDYEVYIKKIVDGLRKIPHSEMLRGRGQIQQFLNSISREELSYLLSGLSTSNGAVAEGRQQRFSRVSNYVTPHKVALNLSAYQGNVLAAVEAADYLLGLNSNSLPGNFVGWMGLASRGLEYMIKDKFGIRPNWGSLAV